MPQTPLWIPGNPSNFSHYPDVISGSAVLAKEGKVKLFLSRFPLSKTESLSEVLEVIARYKLGGNRKGNFLRP